MQTRDTTGRYAHRWGVIDSMGDVEQCQNCAAVRVWKDGAWHAATEAEAMRMIKGR